MGKFGRKSDYTEELNRIIKYVKELRKIMPGKKTAWDKAAEWHMKYSKLHGQSALALTITLSPTGCEWSRKGGCTMCGEFAGSYKGKKLTNNPQFHISQFASAICEQEVWEESKKKEKPIEWLRINQGGNFINPKEMNSKAQEVILRLAQRIGGIKRITIETRPQYITKESVAFLNKIFANCGIELEIGMGFEAKDDVVRNVCINKQGSHKQFSSAVGILRANNILPLAYVLLKPPFLTEMEAIEEADATAHFAADMGFHRISFEPMTIHNYTLVDALVKTGDYTAPWLWSIVEVAKRCSDISSIFGIGGVGYFPVPSDYPSNNCVNGEVCNNKFEQAIMEYNKNRDVKVFDSLSCDCKIDWEQACRQETIPLKERIQKQLDRVEAFLPKYECTNDGILNSSTRKRRLLKNFIQQV